MHNFSYKFTQQELTQIIMHQLFSCPLKPPFHDEFQQFFWQKECKSQMGLRTPKKQGLLNSHYQNSFELTQTETTYTGPLWVYTGPLDIHYSFQFIVFMGVSDALSSLGLYS